MKHPAKLLVVLIALLLPALLCAQSGRELYAAANEIDARADKKLNAAYERLIKSIRAGSDKDQVELIEERLRESQRAWLKYREAQVGFVGAHADIGSSSSRAFGMATYSAELTEQRIKDLKDVPNPF